MSISYKDAGVDVEAGNEFVREIAALTRMTHRPEVLSTLGGFSGLFELPSGYREPVLVSGTDGVGTKLKLATAADRHEVVGVDLVAMAVNDVLVTGAEPLFFLDYFACSRLDPKIAKRVVAGVANGCRQAGCALIGGETAEMPGLYQNADYDLAGFSVGIVEKSEIKQGTTLKPGDALIGLPSSGVHSNGFSLVRALLAKHQVGLGDAPAELQGESVADALLKPTTIYAQPLLKTRALWSAASHITGGGLVENPPRMLSSDALAIQLTGEWDLPPVFRWLQSLGVAAQEMALTFNLGLGMILACPPENRSAILSELSDYGAQEVGAIVNRDGGEAVTWEKPCESLF